MLFNIILKTKRFSKNLIIIVFDFSIYYQNLEYLRYNNTKRKILLAYTLLFFVFYQVKATNTSTSNVELRQQQIKTKKAFAEKILSLSKIQKEQIENYYQEALAFLKAKNNFFEKIFKLKKQITEANNRQKNFNSYLPPVILTNIEFQSKAMSLTEIELKIADLQGLLRADNSDEEKIKEKQNNLIHDSLNLSKEISQLKNKIIENNLKLKNNKSSSVIPELKEAKETNLVTQKNLLETTLTYTETIQALTKIQIKYINNQLAYQTRKINGSKKALLLWKDIKKYKSSDTIYSELLQNNEILKSLENSIYKGINIKFLKRIAEKNIIIANKLIAINIKDKAAQKDLNTLVIRENLLKNDFQQTEKRISMMGLTVKTSRLLQAKRATLQTNSTIPSISAKKEASILNANLESDEILQQAQNYLSFKESIYQKLDRLEDKSDTDTRNGFLTTNTFILLESYRKLLEESGKLYNNYIQTLNRQISVQKEIDNTSEKFRDYINQRLLWASSSGIYNLSDIMNSTEALKWFFSKTNINNFIKDIVQSLKHNPVIWILLGCMLLGSISIQFFFPIIITKISIHSRNNDANIIITILSVILLSSTQIFSIPAATYFIAFYLYTTNTAANYTKALCSGIMSISTIAAFAYLLIYLLKGKGIGETFFKWSAKQCIFYKKYIITFVIITLPFIFIIVAVQNALLTLNFRNSLGRTSALLLLLIYISFLFIYAKNNLKSNQNIYKKKQTYSQYYTILFTVPFLFIILIIFGYYFTVYEFCKGISNTILFSIIVFLLFQTFHRMLYLMKYHIIIKGRKSANNKKKSLEKNKLTSNLNFNRESLRVKSDTLNKQISQLIKFMLIIISIVSLIYIWKDIFPSINLLNNIILWTGKSITKTGEVPVIRQITLLNLLQTVFTFACTFFVVRNIPAIIEILVLKTKNLHAGTKHALELISKYLITCIGIFTGLKFIGIGWSQFQYIAAAMTLGLSFGLQDIFANFVSGIIILFERPIRLGDTVTIGDSEGIVSKIHIRSTTVTDWNRHELIIPNKSFLSEKITNWSLTDQVTRIVINIGISYDSPPKEAEQLMLQIANECPEVLDSPPPSVIFTGFGSNSLDFCLRVFVNLEHQISAQHKIRHQINLKFKEAGIKLPFKQRDIHISPKENPLKIKIVNNS